MRTLDEIITTARLNRDLDCEEARYAIVALDVLLSQLQLDGDVARFQKWQAAASLSPKDYVGSANDPQNPAAVAWYRAMHRLSVSSLHTRDSDPRPDLIDQVSDGSGDDGPASS